MSIVTSYGNSLIISIVIFYSDSFNLSVVISVNLIISSCSALDYFPFAIHFELNLAQFHLANFQSSSSSC